MAEDIIYRPREIYEKMLKRQVHEGAEEYFEKLVKEAGTDVTANSIHVKEYLKAKERQDANVKEQKKFKIIGGLLIFAMILCFVLGIIFLIMHSNSALIAVGSILLVVGVVCLVLRITIIRKKLKELAAKIADMATEVDKLLQICYADMATLNELFDWNMPQRIMDEYIEILKIDPYFKPERLQMMMDKYGLEEETDPFVSVLGVTSGEINGNPFLLEKVLQHDVHDKTYTGSIVITWTTTHRDSQGHMVTEHHSQTLTATVEHPAPFYEAQTRLIYLNEAAPHLKFSRYPSGVSGKSEKEIEKYVNSKSKKLDKKAKDAIKDPSSNFTKMGNVEFDALFGATNRNNEVEFRLLFTPLAQTNIVEIIKKAEPFGDDFVFVKDKMINSIASGHSQHFDYSQNPKLFRSYSYEDSKSKFIKYCDDYTKNLYFDLAPLLSIPLYQMHKSTEYIYGDNYPSHMTSFEHEVMANSMDESLFRPEGSDPSLPLVLKQTFSKKSGDNSDAVGISSLCYTATPRVDYVSKYGNDGRWHEVPVHWVEYNEIKTEKTIEVGFVGASNKSYLSLLNGSLKKDFVEGKMSHYERGILSFIDGISAFGKVKKEFE